jgi:hypothetical protein
VSSRTGRLATGTVHKGQQSVNLELAVEPGEQIDFVVDIGGTLAYDQFLWAPVLREQAVSGSDRTVVSWDAQRDFPKATAIDLLSPREQLTQLLLISNELMFVD